MFLHRMGMRTKANINVAVIDLSALLKQAEERYVVDKRKDYEALQGMRIPHVLGYITAKNGDIYCIEKDGTGTEDPVSDTNPVLINIYPKLTGENGSSVMVLEPAYTASMSKQEILDLPVSTTEDLSEFIDRFGARLERNFALWAEKLTPLV